MVGFEGDVYVFVCLLFERTTMICIPKGDDVFKIPILWVEDGYPRTTVKTWYRQWIE